jgi:hypothetical protein
MQDEDTAAEKNKQDLNLHYHYCKNLKSHKKDFVTRC